MRTRSSWLFLPGAGGSDSLWLPSAATRRGLVTPLPDASSVHDMVDDVRGYVESLPRPRIVVGNSLGALVALEVSRVVPVDGLVLVAVGWQMPVDSERIAQATDDPFSFYQASAERSIRPGVGSRQYVKEVINDFTMREPSVIGHHLRAIQSYQPRQFDTPPPALVIRGGHDRSVSLRSHVELVAQLNGMLCVVRDGSHMPFVDRRAEVEAHMSVLEAIAIHRCKAGAE